MVASKVTPQTLKKLCYDKCIIAFANIKEVNENIRKNVQISEIILEKLKRDFKTRFVEKDLEISSLRHKVSITNDQLQTMVEKYQNCKKELESIQITCERWVKSCNGYEVNLEKQRKNHVKFGVGFRKYDQERQTNTSIDSEMIEIITTTSNGEEIKIT
ncbi:hypothetical protein Hanom_Chr02g00149811 [Helianthus anomalus]